MDEQPGIQAEDRELLAAFAGGDRGALGRLASRHERQLLGLAVGLLGSRELAEEAVQDAWVRVVQNARHFRGKASVRTWLYRITINRCRDIVRREQSQRARLNGKPHAQATEGTPAADADLKEALRRAVEELGPAQREAVLLCHHADLTHAQAAEILQIPLGTLKSRVRNGLNRLELLLREEVGP